MSVITASLSSNSYRFCPFLPENSCRSGLRRVPMMTAIKCGRTRKREEKPIKRLLCPTSLSTKGRGRRRCSRYVPAITLHYNSSCISCVEAVIACFSEWVGRHRRRRISVTPPFLKEGRGKDPFKGRYLTHDGKVSLSTRKKTTHDHIHVENKTLETKVKVCIRYLAAFKCCRQYFVEKRHFPFLFFWTPNPLWSTLFPILP